MKILHTSDLHIGKRVNEYSMLDEQKFILEQIVTIAEAEQPNAIILAGDIYDKNIPSAAAVTLFDDFLVSLARLGKNIFIISGNHDSAERISFASRIMEVSKVHLAPVYNGNIQPIILKDKDTDVAFYLLPYIRPSLVSHYADDNDHEKIKTYDDAMRYVIQHLNLDDSRRNILITHQFITNAERTESEDIIVGGLDNIDASTFEKFDYVALGHLHRPQFCGKQNIRYSGSPLKYSFSEVNDKKSITIIEFNGNSPINITEKYLTPLHEWYDLRGTYDELTARDFYADTDLQEAYVRITLTDEDDIPDGMRRLKTIYHRLTELRYDNKRTRAGQTLIGKPMNVEELNPAQLFGDLFEKQNAQPLSEEQRLYLNNIIDQIFNKR